MKEKSNIIALITDFGRADYFIGAVKGVMKSINPDAEIIDICNDVAPFSIRNAQYILRSSYKYFPKGTVFYTIIDPGVGSDRQALIVHNSDYTFILPDNGIVSAVDNGELNVFRIPVEKYPHAASTFHGRDIFAPIAASIAKGEDPNSLGEKTDSYSKKPFPPFIQKGSVIECMAIHIDTFGNVITSIPNEKLLDMDLNSVSVKTENYTLKPVQCRSYSDLDGDQMGILTGSSGFVELAMGCRSLAERKDIEIENKLIVRIQ